MYTIASQEQRNGEECSKCWPHTVILPVALSLLNDISIGKISVTIYYTVKSWAAITRSVQPLATGWTVRGSNPGGARFPAPVQTGHEAHPTSYAMGTGSFPGGKHLGCGVDHPPHPAPRL